MSEHVERRHLMRVFAMLLVLFVSCAVPRVALAQLAPAQIDVRVTDADGKPVTDARVFLSGVVVTSALTPSNGRLRFDDVEPGLYDVRVERRGYDAVRVGDVEALAGQRRIIDVRLVKTDMKSPTASASGANALQEIGRVTARPPVQITTTDVDEGNPLRRVSENLVDALSKVAGVSIDTSNAMGTLTISLRNTDPTRTIATAGGAPLLGSAAPQLQQIAGDLSSGASINNSGNQGSGVGGSVNFRTLEPTKTWQGALSTSYGTYENTYATFSLSGSVKKLGFAVQHGTRGGDDILTGLTFADTSGLTYRHDGASSRDGDFLKLRYAASPRLTFNTSLITGSYHGTPICHDFVTTLPCGYGPNNWTYGNARSGDLRVQSQIGSISFYAGYVTNANSFTVDEAHLVVAGIPEPFVSTTDGSGRGFYTYTSLPRARHTIALAFGSFVGTATTVARGAFQHPTATPYRNGWFSFQDSDKVSEHWDLSAAAGTTNGVAGSNGSGALAATLHASRNETLRVEANVGGTTGGYTSPIASFGDPASATYNCRSDAVRITGANDPTAPSMSRELDVTYDRRGRRGTIKVNLYDRTEHGAPLRSQFPLLALGAQIPPGYLDSIASIWQQAAICGTTPFNPQRVYVAESVSGATARYRGMDAQGQIVLGRETIAQPSYSINAATLASSDPRLLASGSPYRLGGQLPFRPLHRAGLTIDTRQPKARLEWLVNGQWTSPNNTYALSSYVVTNAGVTWIAPRGRFTLVASNLFNADSGLFGTTEFAQPLSLVGGGTYVPVPALLQPRTYTLIYTVRTGRLR